MAHSYIWINTARARHLQKKGWSTQTTPLNIRSWVRKKCRQSSKCNCSMISPKVIIKAIIIIVLQVNTEQVAWKEKEASLWIIKHSLSKRCHAQLPVSPMPRWWQLWEVCNGRKYPAQQHGYLSMWTYLAACWNGSFCYRQTRYVLFVCPSVWAPHMTLQDPTHLQIPPILTAAFRLV